jgi:hypothetical protein
MRDRCNPFTATPRPLPASKNRGVDSSSFQAGLVIRRFLLFPPDGVLIAGSSVGRLRGARVGLFPPERERPCRSGRRSGILRGIPPRLNAPQSNFFFKQQESGA